MMYKACPGIVLTSICGHYYLVTPHFSIEVNETAAFYWHCLEKGISQSQLREKVLAEYEIDDKEALDKEIESLLQELKEQQLIYMSGIENRDREEDGSEI